MTLKKTVVSLVLESFKGANKSNRFAKFKNHWAIYKKFWDNEVKKGLQGISYVATAPR